MANLCILYSNHTSRINDGDALHSKTYFGCYGDSLACLKLLCDSLEICSRTSNSNCTYKRIFKKEFKSSVVTVSPGFCGQGTSVVISDLFYQMPVRKKCLNLVLELEMCYQKCIELSLMHHHISFTLIDGESNTIILKTPRCSSILSICTYLYGDNLTQNWIPMQHTYKDIKVEGYYCLSNMLKKEMRFVFANKRPVVINGLNKIFDNIVLPLDCKHKETECLNIKVNHGCCSSVITEMQRYGVLILNINCPRNYFVLSFDDWMTAAHFHNFSQLANIIKDCLMKQNLLKCSSIPVIAKVDIDNKLSNENFENSFSRKLGIELYSQTVKQFALMPNEQLKFKTAQIPLSSSDTVLQPSFFIKGMDDEEKMTNIVSKSDTELNKDKYGPILPNVTGSGRKFSCFLKQMRDKKRKRSNETRMISDLLVLKKSNCNVNKSLINAEKNKPCLKKHLLDHKNGGNEMPINVCKLNATKQNTHILCSRDKNIQNTTGKSLNDSLTFNSNLVSCTDEVEETNVWTKIVDANVQISSANNVAEKKVKSLETMRFSLFDSKFRNIHNDNKYFNQLDHCNMLFEHLLECTGKLEFYNNSDFNNKKYTCADNVLMRNEVLYSNFNDDDISFEKNLNVPFSTNEFLKPAVLNDNPLQSELVESSDGLWRLKMKGCTIGNSSLKMGPYVFEESKLFSSSRFHFKHDDCQCSSLKWFKHNLYGNIPEDKENFVFSSFLRQFKCRNYESTNQLFMQWSKDNTTNFSSVDSNCLTAVKTSENTGIAQVQII